MWATLRRRLESEGASFRDLRRDTLNEAAKRLLRRRSSVAEVAEELGFSDFRSFNRAFKAWNGVTPKAYADGAR
jgi:AraC-like DNA-binding protein